MAVALPPVPSSTLSGIISTLAIATITFLLHYSVNKKSRSLASDLAWVVMMKEDTIPAILRNIPTKWERSARSAAIYMMVDRCLEHIPKAQIKLDELAFPWSYTDDIREAIKTADRSLDDLKKYILNPPKLDTPSASTDSDEGRGGRRPINLTIRRGRDQHRPQRATRSNAAASPSRAEDSDTLLTLNGTGSDQGGPWPTNLTININRDQDQPWRAAWASATAGSSH